MGGSSRAPLLNSIGSIAGAEHTLRTNLARTKGEGSEERRNKLRAEFANRVETLTEQFEAKVGLLRQEFENAQNQGEFTEAFNRGVSVGINQSRSNREFLEGLSADIVLSIAFSGFGRLLSTSWNLASAARRTARLGTGGNAGRAATGLFDDAAKAAPGSGDDLVEVFRGTSRASELLAFEETGLVLSHAAKAGFIETGSIREGIARSEAAFELAVERVGSIDELVRLQASLGTDFTKTIGVERSLISVTQDINVARRFAGPNGVVLSAKVPRSSLIAQTLETSTETEFFLRTFAQGFKKVP